ncbi:MAG: alpha/beta hydrolase-fold protein [Planctomycetaceae bacterium]
MAPFDPHVTPAAYLRDTLAPVLCDAYQLDSDRVALCGVGMGGQGALNLAFRHARQFRTVVAIAPDIDFHQWYGQGLPIDRMFPSQEAARQQTAVLHLHPLNWPRSMLLLCDPANRACFDGTERLASKLYSSGVPFEQDLSTTVGEPGWKYVERVIGRAVEFISGAIG